MVLLAMNAWMESWKMLVLAVALMAHLCGVMGAFTQTRAQAQASLVDQDEFVKQPQQHLLDREELKELEELIGNLSSEQLEELQDIMERNHDEMTEFDLIS